MAPAQSAIRKKFAQIVAAPDIKRAPAATCDLKLPASVAAAPDVFAPYVQRGGAKAACGAPKLWIFAFPPECKPVRVSASPEKETPALTARRRAISTLFSTCSRIHFSSAVVMTFTRAFRLP